MFQTFDDAQAFVAQLGVEMVDLKFCDLWGRWHHLTIPASQFMPTLMREGIGFDGSAVGLKSVKAGDMVLVPDLSTGVMDPFWEVLTLSFICSTLEADTHSCLPQRSAQHRPARRGSTCARPASPIKSHWGPEFEFYVFDSVAFENEINRAGYRLEFVGGGLEQRRTAATATTSRCTAATTPFPPKDQLYNLRAEMCINLEAHGRPGEVPPPRGRRAGPVRDRDADGGAAGGRRHDPCGSSMSPR